MLFDHLEVPDDIDDRHRRDDRDPVDLLLFAETVVDFDDRLGSHAFAFEVRSERNPVILVFESQYSDNFKKIAGRNMVDDRSVFDSCNFQPSFSRIFHDCDKL